MTSVEYDEKIFSISEAGFVSRLLKKLNFELPLWLLVLVLVGITWLPLVIMTAVDGTLISGTSLPFLKDMVIQGRVLIGIPLFLLIEKTIYQNTPAVLQYLTEIIIPVEDREYFINEPLQQAKKSTNSNLVEIIILLLVAGVSIGNAEGASLYLDEIDAGSWLVSGKEGSQVLSFAGKWVHYVSFPVFQFLLLRWVWRYIIWVNLLFRISRRRLNLQPTHPDGAGGLGVLLIAQRNFSILFVVCGLVISCEMIGRLLVADNFFDTIKVEITGFIIFSVVMMLFPLFFFSSKLIRAKTQSQLDLGRAGTNLTRQFEGGFGYPPEKNQSLTENKLDPSLHVDLTGVYTNLQQMRIVPVTLRDVFYLTVMLTIPFIPIVFIHFPIAELLQKLMGLLV